MSAASPLKTCATSSAGSTRNMRRTLGKRPLTVFIIPTTRDKLLPEVARGMGDVAIGNLTVTEERLKTVDFASPEDAARREGAGRHRTERRRRLPSTDDLSGQDGSRSQGVELLREPRNAQRALQKGRQVRRETGVSCPTLWKTRT